MTVAISTLGQQVLRRLGVRVVPLDDSPALTEMVPFSDIATGALIELGVLNAADAPAVGAVTLSGIATASLVELGVLNSADPPLTATSDPADIATAALVELGVIASDETPSATDQTLALDKVGSVHGSLAAQGIATWDVSAIPVAFIEEYIKLTAAMAASSFGKTVDPAIVAMLEMRVRVGATVMHNGVAFMEGHVAAVHASLVGQGIASWSANEIPGAFAEEYTKLTTAYAAASFGKPVDPAIIAGLEDHIRRGAAVMTADHAFMLDKTESVHAALDAQGVVWWQGNSVPRAFAEEYVKLTAAMAASVFGKQVDPAMVAMLEARVRKGAMVISADDNANQAVQAVHDDLVMRGIARWSSFDIPDALGDPYVTLAADALAPLFSMDTDPNDTRDAMTAIYRYVALPTSGKAVVVVYF